MMARSLIVSSGDPQEFKKTFEKIWIVFEIMTSELTP